MPLKNKVVIVTGGGTGIGAACAKQLARHNAKVIVNFNSSRTRAQTIAEECIKLGGDAIAVEGNVSNDDQCRAIAEAAMTRWGRIDGLINNAGITKFAPAHDLEALDAKDFLDIYQTNVVGAYQMIRACEKALRLVDGSVVNISSIAGVKAIGSSTAYIASKAALNAMTVSLARALSPEIRVNAVCPGLVDTEWHSNRYSESDYKAFIDKYEESVPLKAAASADDIAETTLWLLSSGRLITGETILVDGGLHLGKPM
jgi:3-oxoacyl-[acyl-carrier protein] reductase